MDAWRRVHRRLTLAIIQSRDNIAAELTQRRYLLEEMNRCKVLHISSQQKAHTPGNSASSTSKSKKTIPASKKDKVKVAAPAPKPKKSKPAAATVVDYIKVAEKISPSLKDLTKIVVPLKAKPSKVTGKQAKKDKTVKEVVSSVFSTTTTTPTTSLPPNITAIDNDMGALSSSYSQGHDEQSNTARNVNVNADVIRSGGELLMSNLRFAGMTSSQPMGQVFYNSAAATAAAAQYGLYGDMTSLGRTGLGMATPEQMGLAFHLLQQMNQSNNNNAASNNDGDGNIRDG